MLQQNHEPEENGYRHQYEDVARTDVPRYDAETARRVVARAAELQADDETFTADGIADLAAEKGVHPRFVRRALAELEVDGEAFGTYRGVRRTRGATRRSVRLTREERRVIGGWPLAYGLFMLSLMPLLYKTTAVLPIVLFCFALPGALCWYQGWRLRQRRLGALAGALTVAATIAGVFTFLFLKHGPTGMDQPFAPVFYALVGGTTLGMMGAEVRNRLPGLLRRLHKLLPVER